jgi:hypothetical protein
MSKDILLEVIKEPLRLLIISLLPLVINWISGQPWNTEFISIAIIIIRAIDKILHDYGKVVGNTTLEGGLTRF